MLRGSSWRIDSSTRGLTIKQNSNRSLFELYQYNKYYGKAECPSSTTFDPVSELDYSGKLGIGENYAVC